MNISFLSFDFRKVWRQARDLLEVDIVEMHEVCSNAGLGDGCCCMIAAMALQAAVGSSPFYSVARVVAKAAVAVGAVRSLRCMRVEDLAVPEGVVGNSATRQNTRWMP